MAIKGTQVWALNEDGAIIVEMGTGSTSVAGWASSNSIPTNEATGKVVMVGVGSGGGAASSSSTAPAGGALAARSLVYMNSTGQVVPANASAVGKEAIGFVQQAYASGATATYYFSGSTLTGLSGLVPGAKYYMGLTDGSIVNEATAATYTSGRVIMQVGTALSATSLLFSAGNPVTV